jgi:hypothetical protein
MEVPWHAGKMWMENVKTMKFRTKFLIEVKQVMQLLMTHLLGPY